MARITALVLACVCLQCHLVAGVPVRLEQDIEAILTERPALNPALVHEINSDENMTWTAESYSMFEGMTRDTFRSKMLGLFTDRSYAHVPVKTYDATAAAGADIPDEFDSYKQWPNFTHPIRDQAHCGSCWAFAASECLSDRFAIATCGSINAVLSPEDMVSCDSSDMGCKGGYIDHAWAYLQNVGIVTDACMPYTAQKGKAPTCALRCANGEPFTKYRVSSYYQLKTEEDIQRDIMTNGPVEAGFRVYSSFLGYKSGVYQHRVFDVLEGGHAIKIVGWGVEPPKRRWQKPVKYWLCANSWTAAWGMGGFFKIRRGADRLGRSECGIQEEVFAGLPLVPDSESPAPRAC